MSVEEQVKLCVNNDIKFGIIDLVVDSVKYNAFVKHITGIIDQLPTKPSLEEIAGAVLLQNLLDNGDVTVHLSK